MTLDFSYQLGGLDLNLKILDEIYHEIWIYVFTRTSKENNGAWKNNGEANTRSEFKYAKQKIKGDILCIIHVRNTLHLPDAISSDQRFQNKI